MTIIELKQFIENLPNDAPVVLCDLSTDDPFECSYDLDIPSLDFSDLTDHEDEPKGKGLIICFHNKLNPNPIQD
jgi:hypothetical protein